VKAAEQLDQGIDDTLVSSSRAALLALVDFSAIVNREGLAASGISRVRSIRTYCRYHRPIAWQTLLWPNRDSQFNEETEMKLSQMRATGLIAAMVLMVWFGLDARGFAQTTSPQGVRNIVLVHGAWADGSCWSGVIALLEAKGLHVVAVQNPLTSFADDVAATKRIIALQDGPVILVGHSYAGVVITEAGNDPKVVGLVYVAAFAPAEGESINSVSKPYAPAPLGSELHLDAEGFLTATRKGIAEDMAQDLPEKEQRILAATQGQTAASVFGATVTKAAWKSKPSWAVVAGNDRAIPPELEKDEAANIKATSITLPANHLAMLSHPREVAELIEQAAAKGK
jgi:pimeloyl-ACP methyl ester carboxylesterase